VLKELRATRVTQVLKEIMDPKGQLALKVQQVHQEIREILDPQDKVETLDLRVQPEP
jgi:hypothetical protein